MKKSLLIFIFLTLPANQAFSCSCGWSWNDAFGLNAKHAKIVALVKIISFDEYLDYPTSDSDEKIPFSMTVEIIKNFKGLERKQTIKIYGDNGMLCRPYLTEFELNGHYLITPFLSSNEYQFFSCRTDYLKVNMATHKAIGNYSLLRKKIDLSTFENKLKYGDWDLMLILILS